MAPMTGDELRNKILAVIKEYDDSFIPAPPSEIEVSSDLQAAINAAASGATLKLTSTTPYVGNFTIDKPLTIKANAAELGSRAIIRTANVGAAIAITGADIKLDGDLLIDSDPIASTQELVQIYGQRTKLFGIHVQGNGKTKRGISAQGQVMSFIGIKVFDVGRVGTESQAIGMWDGDDLFVSSSFLQAGSTPFLAGGARMKIPNHVPTNLVFDACTFSHNLDWRGKGYSCKTGFELKSARNVKVTNSTIENCWKEGQDGHAFTFTPSQADDQRSPETIIENVEVSKCVIKNVGGGINMLGFTQQTTYPTLCAHNFTFVENDWDINHVTMGGRGQLLMVAKEAYDIVFEVNKVLASGDAFIIHADSAAQLKPVKGFVLRGGSVNKVGKYGVFTPVGINGAGFQQGFEGGVIEGNTFTGALSTFKQNFPNNIYV